MSYVVGHGGAGSYGGLCFLLFYSSDRYQRTRLRVVAACTLERESAALGGCVRRHLVGYAGRAAITRRRWYPSTPWTWTSYRWLVHPISRKGPARFYRQSQRMKEWNLRGWPAAAAMWACNMFDAVCPTSDSPYIFSIVLTSVMAAS
jgi:hypothetical protein